MKRSFAAFLVLLALAGAAHAFGLGLGNRFGKLGAISGAGSGGGGGGCTGANFRITNTGAFRITNTGACRSISP